MHCFACGETLETTVVQNGIRAECERCRIDFVSLGHLMSVSDSVLIERIWNHKTDFGGWEKTRECPRCEHQMERIPLMKSGVDYSFEACPDCYLVGIRNDRLVALAEENPFGPEENRVETITRSLQKWDRSPPVRQTIRSTHPSKWLVRVAIALLIAATFVAVPAAWAWLIGMLVGAWFGYQYAKFRKEEAARSTAISVNRQSSAPSTKRAA
jgi:hypothetical protein